MNNVKSLKEIVKQLRSCGYTCEAGPLENNVDFQMLERIAGYVPAEHAFGECVGKRIEKAKQRAVSDTADDLFAQLMSMPPHRPKPKSPQEIRDDIIEQAKRDVAEIVKRGIDVKAKGGSDGNETYRDSFYEVIFNVNKEKRTVVSLIKGATGDGRVFGVRHRGIAKCAPDDCFNVHIGKAIALRRALGLEVPAEYLNAPQPTEVRVGDIVKTFEHSGAHHSTFKVENVRFEVDEIRLKKRKNSALYTEFLPDLGDCIIDDSREEVTE